MASNPKRLPKYQRVSNPPNMRLTERDKRILEAVHAYDGMMSFSQLRRLFFTGKSQAEQRLKLLFQHGYVQRPNRRKRYTLPEMIYWLDKKGAAYVAGVQGMPLQEFSWRREPRWSQVEHDLAVVDFRLDIEESCQAHLEVQMETWIPESEFWAFPDSVEYTYAGRAKKRRVRPDGFFILTSGSHRIRYLLEIDRSTEDNPRFLREKILPGLAYVKTEAYQERFGHRSGRWLVVTTGEKRLKNMLQQAMRANAAGLFYFTTYARVSPDTLLESPIWRRADRDDEVPLLFID